MYIAIKELHSKAGTSNGFLVEYSIKDNCVQYRRTELQKFFPTKEDVIKGLPAILSEAA